MGPCVHGACACVQGEHVRKRDKLKQMATKVLDKTQHALEGAKQKVTRHTTAPGPPPGREE